VLRYALAVELITSVQFPVWKLNRSTVLTIWYNTCSVLEMKQVNVFWCCRKRLLLQAARCLHYNKVAVGDISSSLAACVLSFIAQGRGAQLPHEMVSVTLTIASSTTALLLLHW